MGFLDRAQEHQAEQPQWQKPPEHTPEQASAQLSQIVQQAKDELVVEDVTSIDQEDIAKRDAVLQIPIDQPIKTPADSILEFLKNHKKKASFGQLSKASGLKGAALEKILKVFEKNKIISIHYPVVFTLPATVSLLQEDYDRGKVFELGEEKKQIESYKIMSDFVVAHITIWSVPFENTPVYEIKQHDVELGTKVILEEMVEDLSVRLDIDEADMSDPRKAMHQKKITFQKAQTLVGEYFKDIEEQLVLILSGLLLHKAFGLDDMEVVMSDNWLEEIAINGDTEPMSVYHKRFGWVKTTKYFAKEYEIYNFAAQIGRKVGKQITSLSPIMDAHLQTGDRVAATLFPVSTEGDTITIRRFSRNPWTVVHMLDEKNHTMSKEMMAFLWMIIQYELNFLVVGGTASGKTSVLNTLCSLIPSTNRIISIEDTREISLPSALHWNWVPLTSKTANAEGQGEVSMLDLMVASLRMRPDRIIVGEIRRKQQAEAMFEAMHTGHSVGATMHADTADQIKHRLTQPPIDIPENELQALQLILVQYRDRRKGVRRTLEIAELLPGSAEEKINLNYLYRWRPRTDTFSKDEPSVRVVEDLNLHTGMTQAEIEAEIAEKELILEWLLKNKMFDMDKIGHIMRIYYKYPQLLLDTIKDEGSAEGL